MKKKTTVMLLTLLTVAAFALPLASAATKGTWTGWITDQSCGAKGAKAEHKDCLKKCLDNGDKLVFYNTGDEKLYALDDQAKAKEHIGHEVKITGEVDGSAIKVEAIEAAKAM